MKPILYSLLCVLLFSCENPVVDIQSLDCLTYDLDIGIEHQDPYYSNPIHPDLAMTAIDRWLWKIENDTLKIFSKADVSDETVEYHVYVFSINSKGCLTPVLYSNFDIEIEIVLNQTTNEYESFSHISKYSEDTFALKVEEYIGNQLLKARITYDTKKHAPKDIYVELIQDNYYEMIYD